MENSWDRQPTETDPAFEAFNAYLATGSLRDAYRQLSGKASARNASGCWTGWSTKHHWVSRRSAFLDHTVRACQEAELAAQVEIARNIKACELALVTRAHDFLTSTDSVVFLRGARAFTLQHPPVQQVEDVTRIEDLPDLSDADLGRMRAIRDEARQKNEVTPPS